MRRFACALTIVLASFAGDLQAAGRFGNSTSRGYGNYSSSYSYPSSSTYSSNNSAFLYRGYNPGHIFGNTVRRVYWGPSMSPGY